MGGAGGRSKLAHSRHGRMRRYVRSGRNRTHLTIRCPYRASGDADVPSPPHPRSPGTPVANRDKRLGVQHILEAARPPNTLLNYRDTATKVMRLPIPFN